jgi:hypothetical protein
MEIVCAKSVGMEPRREASRRYRVFIKFREIVGVGSVIVVRSLLCCRID